MSARWEDTVDTQGEVYQHLRRSLSAYSTVLGRRSGDADSDARYAQWLTEGCASWASAAAPIYITSEMLAVWQAAERAFQPEAFRESDLIVHTGFALLPKSIDIVRLISDYDPNTTEGDLIPVRVRALLWGPEADKPGEFGIIGLGYPDEQPEGLGFEGGAHVWAPVLTDGLAIGRQFERRDNCQRAFQALFALMRQFLPVPERLPRSRRRAALRAGLPTEVKIMRLRRVQRGPSEQAEPVDWNWRWVVEGHWRNQWYPSIGEHRQKWIDGYIKGPEDKPLRDPLRVIGLVK